MKTLHRTPMLPLAALLAAGLLSACANSPMTMGSNDLSAPAAATDRNVMASNVPVGETRDWAAIDKDKDNLISAAEMAAYLDASRKAK